MKFQSGRTPLVVSWLRLHTFSAENSGSIPSRGTKILQASWCGKKKKKKIAGKEHVCKARDTGDTGSILGLGRSPGE